MPKCKSSNFKHFNRANTKHYFRTYSKETIIRGIIRIIKNSKTTCRPQWAVATSSYWWTPAFKMVQMQIQIQMQMEMVRAAITQRPWCTSNSWSSSSWHSSINSTRYSSCLSSKVLVVVCLAMAISKSSYFNSNSYKKKTKRTSHSWISR